MAVSKCVCITTGGSLGCRQDICCVSSNAILSKDTRHLNPNQWDPAGALKAPLQGGVEEVEMSGVFSAAASESDVLAADTKDVLSAAKAASGGDDAYNF